MSGGGDVSGRSRLLVLERPAVTLLLLLGDIGARRGARVVAKGSEGVKSSEVAYCSKEPNVLIC